MAELRFDGKVVLITGGGRGMGRVHAEQFAARGAKVIVSDVGTSIHGVGADRSVALEVVDAIRDAGGEAQAYLEDLATEVGARGAVKHALTTYGRIDTIVHNAGISLGGMPYERESLQRLRRLQAINTEAGYVMTAEAWPVMQQQKYGRIVMIGSTAWYGVSLNVPYATAKSSYLGFTRSLAEEGVEFGIKVNLVGPSGVSRMSESMPDSTFSRWFRRTMKPELVTPVVLLLGHERCPVTGETFAVAGGRVARMVMAETPGLIKADLTPEDVLANMSDITSGPLTPFADYSESAKALMNAFGFKSTERLGQVSSPPPPPPQR
jgi:NAD(P)-dependent dehydrogenase (short-subunit alcohol dehydrogenase family)